MSINSNHKIPEFTTLIEALQSRSLGSKGITYIQGTQQENRCSYQQLLTKTLGILKVFQDKGLKESDELIIFTPNNELFVDAFWACLLGGIIPVPVSVGISDEHRAKLFRIYDQLENPFLYTDEKNFNRLQDYAQSNRTPVSFTHVADHSIVAEKIGDISSPGKIATITANSRAFIQYSSGSTSEPKGVILTHKNIMTTIVAIGERAQYTEQDISLSWMPLTHDLGLIGFHLSMVVYDMDQYLMPTDLFSRRPILWLKKAGEHQATVLTSPNFGFKHFLKTYSADKFSGVNLESIRIILNGAEPICIDLCHKFLDTMEAHQLRRSAMYTVYGLAEACLGVTLPIPGKEFEFISIDRHKIKIGDPVVFVDKSNPDCVRFAIEGPIVENCEIKITDFENNILKENFVGEIQIKGPNVTSGFYRNDEANTQAFTGDGWLNTGDVGILHDSQLIVTGRTKDILFINGQNYYPHDLENIALRCQKLELGKVVAFGVSPDLSGETELIIFILFRGEHKDFLDIASEVRKHINQHMGLEVTHVIPVKNIPKTTSGKIQRHMLGQAYLDGEYDDLLRQLNQAKISTPTSIPQGNLSKIQMQFQAICSDAVTDKNINIEDNLFEVGISSLILAEIHQKIDELYPGEIDITDMFDHQTLLELASFLKSKLDAKN